MKKYIFEHKLVQIPHPITKALMTVSVSQGQHTSSSRYFRNQLKKLTRKQRQTAIKSLKKRGVIYNA